VAARSVVLPFITALTLVLGGLALEAVASTGAGEAVLASVSSADGSTRSVLYIPADVGVWDASVALDAFPVTLAPLAVLLAGVAVMSVAKRRRSTDPVPADRRLTVVRGLRHRPSQPQVTDRAA